MRSGADLSKPESGQRPVAVDLFAGAGGMSLGFEQAGFDVVAGLEVDRAHAAVHRFNFPRCQVVQADAADVSRETMMRAVEAGLRRHGRDTPASPVVDVVFGGPPCQGFSVGGLLNPNDPRNRLVEQFARLVDELRPRAFVLENVPAMASRALPGEDRSVPDWLTDRMRRIGYEVGPSMALNASNFGVPQDRRRLVIVGVLAPAEIPDQPVGCSAPVPKDPGRRPRRGEAGHRETPADLFSGPTVDDAIRSLPDLDDFDELLHHEAARLPAHVRAAIADSASDYARRMMEGRADDRDLSWPRRRSPSLLTASLRTIHKAEVVERFAATACGEREPISRFFRLHPRGISPTLRAGSTPDRGSFSAPRPIHPRLDRVISVREAARLHGYPDWFRFSGAKWHGFRQVGNSVCPPIARAVASAVRDACDLPSVKPLNNRQALGKTALLLVASGSGRASAKTASGQRARGGNRPEASSDTEPLIEKAAA